MKKLFLVLLAIVIQVSMHAQSDTAYLGTDPSGNEWIIVGKGGIKVEVKDGMIILDGSGITDFAVVDTVAKIVPYNCHIPACLVLHDPDTVNYVIMENRAGMKKEIQTPIPTYIENPKDGEIINSIDGQYIFYKNEWHKIEEQ